MFKPLEGYILVLPIERKQSDVLWVTPEKFNRGVVVAAGPGERLKRKNGSHTGAIRPMSVKPGDFILYGEGLDWIYPKYTEDGIEYRICEDKDVCGVVDVSDFDAYELDLQKIQEIIASHRPTLQSLGVTHAA